jgi:hypothetical protein
MLLKRIFRPAAITLILASVCAQAADRDVRVLSYEPVALEFGSTSAALLKTSSTASSLRYSAFGSSYVAKLETNVSIQIPANSSAQAYRGSIDGRDNSWLRITRVGNEVHGLIFDGNELFAVEPAADIGGRAADGMAIFRLADTQTELGAEFCASLKVSDDTSGLAIYKSLSGESKTILAQMQKSGARSRLQLSAIMDLALRNRFGSDAAASDAIVARMNNVDGIFTSQLGIEVQLVSTLAPEAPSSPFLSSTNPESLLQVVSKLRSETPSLYSTGTTHLFTGSDLDGKTIGIAYMDAVCGQRYAASLSELRDRGSWFDALVAAHELGHGFGSPHDSEGECAATPTTFLMAPTISGNDRFSQCSLNRIQTRMQTATCLIPIPVADISVPALGDYHMPSGVQFAWSFPVANIGNGDALDSTVQITIPPSLSVLEARTANGACTVGGGTVSCNLGMVAAHEVRNVDLTLLGSQNGAYTIAVSVNSVGDATASNNSASATIHVEPSLDVSVSLDAPGTASIDQAFSATFAVVNKSTASANNVSVDIVVPSGLTVSGTPQFDGVACQIQFQTLRCFTATLSAGRTISSTISLVAHEPGTQTLTATIGGDFGDPQPFDNAAQRSIVVAMPAGVATASAAQANQESGGGSFGIYFLGVIAALLQLRRRIRAN